MDKLWSLLPILYVGYVMWKGDFDPRLVVMCVLTALWGIRLTGNFALKGAYKWKFWEGEEDYRWSILRAKKNFSRDGNGVCLTCFYFVVPEWAHLVVYFTGCDCFRSERKGNVWFGLPGSRFDVFFIVFEMVADWQQWQYQSGKWKAIKQEEN